LKGRPLALRRVYGTMFPSLKKIKRWAGSHYALSRQYHRWRLNREAKKPGDPVIVYQMGKVASTAIVDAIHASRPELPVYHVHFLTDEGMTDALSRLRRIKKRFNANFWCLYESEYVLRNVLTVAADRRLKIVTLFREPVARTISSFFYNIKQHIADFERIRIDDASFVPTIEKRYLEDFMEHDYSINWFDNELKRTFGVDVYQHKFDYDKGYTVIRGVSVDVLVLKLERLKDCARIAFSEFLDIPELDLSRANTSEDQSYHEYYRKFVNEVKLPGTYLDKMYGSKYMRHFYSSEEIAAYRAKWGRD